MSQTLFQCMKWSFVVLKHFSVCMFNKMLFSFSNREYLRLLSEIFLVCVYLINYGKLGVDRQDKWIKKHNHCDNTHWAHGLALMLRLWWTHAHTISQKAKTMWTVIYVSLSLSESANHGCNPSYWATHGGIYRSCRHVYGASMWHQRARKHKHKQHPSFN